MRWVDGDSRRIWELLEGEEYGKYVSNENDRNVENNMNKNHSAEYLFSLITVSLHLWILFYFVPVEMWFTAMSAYSWMHLLCTLMLLNVSLLDSTNASQVFLYPPHPPPPYTHSLSLERQPAFGDQMAHHLLVSANKRCNYLACHLYSAISLHRRLTGLLSLPVTLLASERIGLMCWWEANKREYWFRYHNKV